MDRKIIDDVDKLYEFIKLNNRSYFRIIKSNFLDFYNFIDKKYPDTDYMPEKFYLYCNNIPNVLKCDCGAKLLFQNVINGYKSKKCSKCYTAHRKQNSIKQKTSSLQKDLAPVCKNIDCKNLAKKNKNGTWSAYCSLKCRGQYNSISSRKKAKETMIKNHGVEHALQSSVIKNNMIQAKRQKYGSKYNLIHCNKNENVNLDVLRDKDRLMALYNQHTPYHISKILQVPHQTVYHYLYIHGLKDFRESSLEKYINDFLNELDIINFKKNDRTIIKPKEVDYYLPEYNIALEINGLYWHSEGVNNITKMYHLDKFLDCERKGIQLITIFEDYLYNKLNVVKNTLRYKFNKCQQRVFARKCQIVTPSNDLVKTFLNNYHIQGYTHATYCFGLVYDDSLVAVMTFSEPRLGVGKSKHGCGIYELVRFCTSGTVVGGASKLLKYFIKCHNPKQIYSFSNNEWSSGNLYKTIGFTLDKELPPDYAYIDLQKTKRLHRYQFAKYKLVKAGYDKDKTENQIMLERGYKKIWDCGKRRWILDC